MAVTVTKLNAVRGDTNVFSFAYSGDTPTSVFFEARLSTGALLCGKSLGFGIVAVDGGYQVTLESADTSSLTSILHVLLYSLKVVTTGGSTTTLYQGSLFVFPESLS